MKESIDGIKCMFIDLLTGGRVMGRERWNEREGEGGYKKQGAERCRGESAIIKRKQQTSQSNTIKRGTM